MRHAASPNLASHPTRQTAGAIGLMGTAAATLVMWACFNTLPAEVPALVLLVPTTAASVLSSWRIGLPIAIIGAVTFGLVFLPPIGTIRIGFTEDVMILATFVAVSMGFSVLVSRRSIANRAELIGRERMVLLRTLSHDLRSPLQTILAATTELVRGPVYDPATQKEMLVLVLDETHRLDRIVNNLLSLSRLHAGALIPDCAPMPAKELVTNCQNRFGVVGRDGATLRVVEPVPDLEVLVDDVQIDQVLTNLIENAVRHSPVGVNVTLSVRAVGAMAEWCVADDGPGFSDTARAELFTPFRSERGSAGLGLTLCKAIVEAHGGKIAVDPSTAHASATGASVRFTVPLASARS
jgi:two-component system sensor histidine kinase KdpD